MNNNNVSSDILATGAAVGTGIASYYQGKSQAQLAKKNPTAYLQLKKQQNRMGLIILFVFLGLFALAVIIIIIVAITSSKPMSFTPEKYYSFTVFDGDGSKPLPEQFTKPKCNVCDCIDNTKYEFYDVPHTVLMNKDYTGDLYLTYYTSMIGTGRNIKTKVKGALNVEPTGTGKDGERNKVCALGGLDNFWRSVTNLDIGQKSYMSISQACPIRVCDFKDLLLCYGPSVDASGNHTFNCCPNPDPTKRDPIAEFTSGGFISDCTFGKLNLCSQQQFIAQNCTLPGEIGGGAWNIVYYNCTNAPSAQNYQPEAAPAITVISSTDIPLPKGNITQPPLLYFQDNKYILGSVDISSPDASVAVANPGNTPPNRDQILLKTAGVSLDDFFTNNQSKSTLVIPAGVYYITKPHTVTADLIGVGMAIIRFWARSKITFQKNKGIIYSLVCDNMEQNDILLDITGDNVSVFDVFFRNGGPSTTCSITNTMLRIQGKDCYLNNLWIWRADHGTEGTFKKDSTDCPAVSGLIVDSNANNCTAIGLAVEHFDQTNVVWKGDNGKCAFFQNEMPYFVKSFNYPAVDIQNNFTGYAMGSYCYFRDYPVIVSEAFKVNKDKSVRMKNIFTVWLNSDKGGEGSEIQHIINDTGASSNKGVKGIPQFLTEYVISTPSNPSTSSTPSNHKSINFWRWFIVIMIIILIIILIILIIWLLRHRNTKQKKIR